MVTAMVRACQLQPPQPRASAAAVTAMQSVHPAYNPRTRQSDASLVHDRSLTLLYTAIRLQLGNLWYKQLMTSRGQARHAQAALAHDLPSAMTRKRLLSPLIHPRQQLSSPRMMSERHCWLPLHRILRRAGGMLTEPVRIVTAQ